MPLVRDENLVKLYEEADKAKETIKNLSAVLEAEENNNTLLKKQRIVLGIFSLAMLVLFLWSFLPKSKQYKEEYLIENNLSFIDTDSLHQMQRKIKQINVMDSLNVTTNEMSIVYSVQIGAYVNFNSKLISDDLAQLEEFEDAGYNKFAIGKFTSYKEAVELRDDMKRLGFKDSFIIAKSYGILVNMSEALELSGEKWIRGNTN